MDAYIEIRIISKEYHRCEDSDRLRNCLERKIREDTRISKLALKFHDVLVSGPEEVMPKRFVYHATIRYKVRPDKIDSLALDEPFLRAGLRRDYERLEWRLVTETRDESAECISPAVMPREQISTEDFPGLSEALCATLTEKLSPHEVRDLRDEMKNIAKRIRLRVFEELKGLSQGERQRLILKSGLPPSIDMESHDELPDPGEPRTTTQQAEPNSSPSEARSGNMSLDDGGRIDEVGNGHCQGRPRVKGSDSGSPPMVIG